MINWIFFAYILFAVASNLYEIYSMHWIFNSTCKLIKLLIIIKIISKWYYVSFLKHT